MKERPILFSTEMVKAILEGRKTMTRRVKGLDLYNANLQTAFHFIHEKGNEWSVHERVCNWAIGLNEFVKCPYGQVGDRLWVRETWCGLRDIPNGLTDINVTAENYGIVHYKATTFPIDSFKWKPSIHMPRWASRITLEITNIRVERLQEITYDDCFSEGAIQENWEQLDGSNFKPQIRDTFHRLWDTINAKRGYSWQSNPWIWVIEYRRINQ